MIASRCSSWMLSLSSLARFSLGFVGIAVPDCCLSPFCIKQTVPCFVNCTPHSCPGTVLPWSCCAGCIFPRFGGCICGSAPFVGLCVDRPQVPGCCSCPRLGSLSLPFAVILNDLHSVAGLPLQIWVGRAWFCTAGHIRSASVSGPVPGNLATVGRCCRHGSLPPFAAEILTCRTRRLRCLFALCVIRPGDFQARGLT